MCLVCFGDVLFSVNFKKTIKKAILNARDILEQQFDGDSHFSGSNFSGEDGRGLYLSWYKFQHFNFGIGPALGQDRLM